MRFRTRGFAPTIASLATAYDDQSGDTELVIPETFDGLDDEALASLYAEATSAFDALLEAAGESPSPEQLEQLGTLTEAVEALGAETAEREAARAERAEAAAALAARVRGTEQLSADTAEDEAPADDSEDEEEEGDAEGGDAEDEGSEDASTDEGAAGTVVASGAQRTEIRVPLNGIRRQAPAAPAPVTEAPAALVASGEVSGFSSGAGMTMLEVGKAIDQSLTGYNEGQYAAAAKVGRHLRQQNAIASVTRQFSADRVVGMDSSPSEVARAIRAATDESLVRGRNGEQGLIASGGWCAPSETTYDLLELESRDGLLSLPELGITRGGIRYTRGPSFADIYSQFPGFHFTEQDDIEGKYQPGADGNVEGDKPCVKIDCPDFDEVRLEVSGLCITAGILQQRGYPEVIARTVRGALTAHAHRVDGIQISRIVAGSDAVTIPGVQAGATAPVLTAIELQAEHIRYTHRLPRNSVLEGVFPFWIRGAVRADLARRQGLALFEVTDAQIDAWFRGRGLAPQFVYNWQPLTGAASSLTAFPETVTFLIYPAGTWVRGVADLITLDTLYDSVLLGSNDFTALFTEEAWLLLKAGFDSRAVTVPLCADGATHAGVEIECNGTIAPVDGGDAGGEG